MKKEYKKGDNIRVPLELALAILQYSFSEIQDKHYKEKYRAYTTVQDILKDPSLYDRVRNSIYLLKFNIKLR